MTLNNLVWLKRNRKCIKSRMWDGWSRSSVARSLRCGPYCHCCSSGLDAPADLLWGQHPWPSAIPALHSLMWIHLSTKTMVIAPCFQWKSVGGLPRLVLVTWPTMDQFPRLLSASLSSDEHSVKNALVKNVLNSRRGLRARSWNLEMWSFFPGTFSEWRWVFF